MDSQKVERRDSKKSNKGSGNKSQGRGGGGNSSGGSGGGSNSGGNGKPSGEKQRSHSQKSGKPYREIYKPPSLRSSKNRNSNSSSEGSSKNEDVGQLSPKKNNINQSSKNGNNQNKNNSSSQQYNESNMDNQNGYSLFGKSNGAGNGNGSSSSHSSVPSSPLLSNRMQNSLNFDLAKRFNVDAKEFQFLPMQHQQQQQQLSKFLSQFDPSLLYGVNSPILNSPYPLKQSKSSGNMNFLQQQQQQQQQIAQAQAAALQQLQNAIGLGFGNLAGAAAAAASVNASNSINQFNRLSQSKSSGNVPGAGKPRVRFDDEDDFDDEDLGLLASLKLNGDLTGMPALSNNFANRFPFQQQTQANFSTPQKPSLHKSRTGFYLNMHGTQQLGSPTKSSYSYGNAGTGGLQSPGFPYVNKLGGSGQQSSQFVGGGMPNVVKRSRSFGPGNHYAPKISATSLLSASTPPSTGHSIYADFCLKSWPRAVQVLVTDAVVGVERIPTRNWIEMVNGIFEAMLCNYRPTKTEKAESLGTAGSASGRNSNEVEDDENDDEDDETDLTTAAVHIFLYFVQKEKDKKDRIVMESLLNTCFAYFQRLSSTDKRMTSMAQNFLRFLSTLYSQVKLRHKQTQQQPGMDEMSFSLLAMLADFIATLIRSPPSDEMMGYLFTVLTSHGRDIEFFHPLKMKRLLAGVRDVLLGIGPYYQQQGSQNGPSGLSPMVQKTLMQLIELHASNWQLCASQVSYYHCKSTNPTNFPNVSSSSSGNSQAQKTSKNSSTVCNTAKSASSPECPSPPTSSTVSNVSNDTVDGNNDVSEIAAAASLSANSENNSGTMEIEEEKVRSSPISTTDATASENPIAVTQT